MTLKEIENKIKTNPYKINLVKKTITKGGQTDGYLLIARDEYNWSTLIGKYNKRYEAYDDFIKYGYGSKEYSFISHGSGTSYKRKIRLSIIDVKKIIKEYYNE